MRASGGGSTPFTYHQAAVHATKWLCVPEKWLCVVPFSYALKCNVNPRAVAFKCLARGRDHQSNLSAIAGAPIEH